MSHEDPPEEQPGHYVIELEDHCRKLKAEVDQLKEDMAERASSFSKLYEEAAEIKAENEQLRESLLAITKSKHALDPWIIAENALEAAKAEEA